MRQLLHLQACAALNHARCAHDAERGASAVEYGLLLAGIAALIVVAVYLFGGSVMDLFSTTCKTLSAAQSSGSCS